MTRGEMDSHEMHHLVEASDQAWQAARGRLIQRLPAEESSPRHGEFWKHRNVYDDNGEYELPIARHYVPQYWRS